MPREKATIYTLPLHHDKILRGSEGGQTRPERDIPNYVKLCQAGKLNLKQIITNHYPFEKINDAIADIRAGNVPGRCIVQMKA